MREGKTEDRVRARLMVRGRVQGVFFRASTVEVAARMGVGGWVRNRRDGSVEVLAEGEEKKVKELIQWCHRGPPGAQVQDVEVQWEDYQGTFKSFAIER